MLKIIIESPYAGKTPGETARNVRYAQACMRHIVNIGYTPLATHLLYTQPNVLDNYEKRQ